MKVQTAKRMLRLQEWAVQINACQRSGLRVREWCEQQGIKVKTYYNRMRRVREEILESANTGAGAPNALMAVGEQIRPYMDEKLSVYIGNKISKRTETPVFAPAPVPAPRSAAVTVQLGEYAVDIQNGADESIVEQVLRLMARL